MTTLPRESLHALLHDPERMGRLYAAAATLVDATTLDALVKRVVQAARSLSRTDCASLTLLDGPAGASHVVWSGYGCDRGEVVLERELIVGGRPFGILRLRTMGAKVAREDEALVDLLCVHAAVAIETVSLRSQDELVRRMRALVDTQEPAPVGTGSIREVGDIRIDLVRHAVFVGDTRVHVTPSEFHLLELLSEDPGRAYSRDEIVERLWGGLDPGSSRVADVHVARLRRKLARGAPGPGRVESVRGVGYRLTSAANDACPTCARTAHASEGTGTPSPA
jgi:DNA-binding winged helix-turn-helix (wHTH) protein